MVSKVVGSDVQRQDVEEEDPTLPASNGFVLHGDALCPKLLGKIKANFFRQLHYEENFLVTADIPYFFGKHSWDTERFVGHPAEQLPDIVIDRINALCEKKRGIVWIFGSQSQVLEMDSYLSKTSSTKFGWTGKQIVCVYRKGNLCVNFEVSRLIMYLF